MLTLPARAKEQRHGVDMETVRLLLGVDIAGIRGDWQRVERDLEQLASRPRVNKERLQSVKAFWLAVQGRYEEAAQSMALAGPVPEDWIPPVMGGDANYGLMETAQVRILRATGRKADADRLVSELLQTMRAEREAAGASCESQGRTFAGWMRHASLAANEGLKDEAVDALAGAMRCGELPPAFLPQLPWFRQLDGHPPYEALKRERERRIERIRAELIKIETESGLATGQQALQSPVGSG
jgi:hypothetical protein